jgi:hypothetical protein
VVLVELEEQQDLMAQQEVADPEAEDQAAILVVEAVAAVVVLAFMEKVLTEQEDVFLDAKQEQAVLAVQKEFQ